METNRFSINVSAHNVDRVVRNVHAFLTHEREIECDESIVRTALVDWTELKSAGIWEQAEEVLTSPHHGAEISEFIRIVELRIEESKKPKVYLPNTEQPHLFDEKENSLNGFRPFSFDKLSAMIVHLSYRGKNVMPTRLNKLLFYADFSYFHGRNQSISGTGYTKLTHGPIYDGYRNILRFLEKKRQIRIKQIKSKGQDAQIILPKKSYRPSKSILSKVERNLLDWIVQTYDHLSTPELIKMSHREMAYWDTNWRELIDYKYSKNLEYVPPPYLFD